MPESHITRHIRHSCNQQQRDIDHEWLSHDDTNSCDNR